MHDLWGAFGEPPAAFEIKVHFTLDTGRGLSDQFQASVPKPLEPVHPIGLEKSQVATAVAL